jgi:hypothetical protein
MPYSDKALGEAMQQETPDELDSWNRHLFLAVSFSVLDLEGNTAILKGSDTAIGNGHPVGVTG